MGLLLLNLNRTENPCEDCIFGWSCRDKPFPETRRQPGRERFYRAIWRMKEKMFLRAYVCVCAVPGDHSPGLRICRIPRRYQIQPLIGAVFDFTLLLGAIRDTSCVQLHEWTHLLLTLSLPPCAHCTNSRNTQDTHASPNPAILFGLILPLHHSPVSQSVLSALSPWARKSGVRSEPRTTVVVRVSTSIHPSVIVEPRN